MMSYIRASLSLRMRIRARRLLLSGLVIQVFCLSLQLHYTTLKMIYVSSGAAHDIAQYLYETGVDVMMLQRSSTYVISMKAIENILSM